VASLLRWTGRAIGLDVHRDFCVVAICEDGVVRSAGRVPSSPQGIRTLAESLLTSDRRRGRLQWPQRGRGQIGSRLGSAAAAGRSRGSLSRTWSG